MILKFIFFISSFLLSLSIFSQHFSSLEERLFDIGLVDIRSCDSEYIIDLKYATPNNFTKQILYDSLQIPFLHPEASQKLCKAHFLLKTEYPNYRFIIFDAARPLSIQRQMYEVVQGTPYRAYVANPSNTGLHNYGMALDLSIIDISKGIELDMGTPFDFFGAKAGIRNEEEMVERGLITQNQRNNRLILRDVMERAGFKSIYGEWWHFNAVSRSKAKAYYSIIE